MSVTKSETVDLLPGFFHASADHPYPGHSVQFYTEDSFLLDAVSRFVGTALGAGDSAVIIATKAHRDGVATRLKTRGLDVAKAAQQGRYIALDARETLMKFLVDGYPDATLFANLIGPVIEKVKSASDSEGSRTFAFGEMVALLWEEQNVEAAIRLEQLWNDLAKTHSFSLRCAYPITEFHRANDGAPLLKICAEHSNVVPSEAYTGLSTEEERLRDVTRLQQKEQSHDGLQRAKDQLEQEVNERMEIERKLLESERSLRELSGHILRMQDEERRRIGLDLHDSVGQYLSVLKMHLDTMAAEATGGKVAMQMADCVNLVEESIREVRTMAYLLYPPTLEEMGLRSAIPWYLDGFTKHSGIRTSFEISPGLGRLARGTELAIFRIVQESLTNVHRHSGSGGAQVLLLLQRGRVRVEVRDQGKGFKPETLSNFAQGSHGSLSLGLRGMGERVRHLGGRLELFSGDEGATVIATVPFVEEARQIAKPDSSSGSECDVIYPD